ncbi:hypothetical protein [Mycobacterium decipiens]|nr:hypothetical protein [Mycobacterium decipiens]
MSTDESSVTGPAGPGATPPSPRRLTLAPVSVDGTAAHAAAETRTQTRPLAIASPRFFLSHAEGAPVLIKQVLQLCLILVYPVWMIAGVLSAAAYYPLCFIIWLLRKLPHVWTRKNRPAGRAASEQK